MVRKILICLLLMSPAFGARYTQKQLVFEDMWGERVTGLTSVTIRDAGTADTATIYSDRIGTSMTNPIVSGLGDGQVTFWSAAASYRVVATDGTDSLNVDNMTGSKTWILWMPEYINALSNYNLGDDNNLNFGTGNDWVLDYDGSTGLRMLPAADDSDVQIGSATYTSDLYLYGGTSGYNLYWDASENTLEFLDNTILAIGTGDDLTLSHNGTTTTMSGAWSQSGTLTVSASDVLFDDTYDIHWDTSEDTLGVLDNAVLGFGNTAAAPDVEISWNATNLLIEAKTDNTGQIQLGSTNSMDLVVYGSTATDIALFDASAGALLMDSYPIAMGDGDAILFGDTLGTGDFSLSSTSAVLSLGQVVAGTGTIAIGADDAGIDVTFYGDTASQYLLWDTSEDTLTSNLGNVLFTTVDAEVDQFKVDATGTGAGDVINLETTDGGIMLNADGAANGDIELNSADDLILTAAGALTGTVTGAGAITTAGWTITSTAAIAHNGAVIQTSTETQVHTANDTMDTAADVGRLHQCATDTVVFTLPAVATGLKYKFMNTGADGAVEIHVDTNGSDKILGGCGFTALDDGDKITNTKASADYGDYVVIEYGTADGWYITEMVGTWADGGA